MIYARVTTHWKAELDPDLGMTVNVLDVGKFDLHLSELDGELVGDPSGAAVARVWCEQPAMDAILADPSYGSSAVLESATVANVGDRS